MFTDQNSCPINRIYLSYTKYVDNLPYYASSRLCRVLYFRNQISCWLYLDIEFCSKFIVRLCNTILLKINSMPCLVCYEIFEIFCRLLGNVWHVNISFQCVGPITTYIKKKIQSSLNIWPTIISIIIRRYHILTFWTYQ